MRELSFDRSQASLAVASAAMLAALATAMLPDHPTALVIGLAAVGIVAATARLAPGALRLIARRRSLALVLLLAVLILAWVVAGLLYAGQGWSDEGLPTRLPYLEPAWGYFGQEFVSTQSWPWRIGHLPLLPLVLAILCAAGGFVLIADSVRVQLGLAQPPRSGWRLLTSAPTRGGRIAIRAIPGVALVGVAAFLGITLASRYLPYDHPIRATLVTIGIGLGSALLIAGPVAVGMSLRLDFDKEGSAREEERLRFAAHLHDSVLQTLALIQRQAADPDAVTKLARRQEYALRAWMAGEADLSSATVATALREMIAEVEDEQGIKVELTATGDAKLDAHGEELIAAAREALRNAAHHAPGAAVNVFLDTSGNGIELFVRDSGPGFEFDDVPPGRRGLRDAVIGRMNLAGGSATVESRPGEGTEILLKLPQNGRPR